MEGGSSQEEMGVIPRTFHNIFERINDSNNQEEFLIWVSMLEIYNEKLKDSLSNANSLENHLEIHGDQQSGFFVKNLQSHTVSSP